MAQLDKRGQRRRLVGSLIGRAFQVIQVAQVATIVFTPSAGCRAGMLLVLAYWLGSERVFRTKSAKDDSMKNNKAKGDTDRGTSIRNTLVGLSQAIVPVIIHAIDPLATRLPGGLPSMITSSTQSWLPSSWIARALLVQLVVAASLRWYSMALLGDRFTRVLRVIRHHSIVTSGPYAWIRHPGYAGNGLVYIGGALLLTSNWVVGVLALVSFGYTWGLRILAEEDMLKDSLAGYEDFCKTTKYRLVPFVW